MPSSNFIYIVAQIPSAADRPDGAFHLTDLLWPVGILLVAAFILIQTRRKVARSRRKDSLSVRQRVEHVRRAQDASDRIGELMVELANLSRQINGQLDTRMAKIDVLLQQADEKIAVLEQLLQGTTDPIPSHSLENNNLPHSRPNRKGPINEASADSMADDNPLLGSPGNRQVIELAQQGRSVTEIAAQLKRPIGEIELIITLARKKT